MNILNRFHPNLNIKERVTKFGFEAIQMDTFIAALQSALQHISVAFGTLHSSSGI